MRKKIKLFFLFIFLICIFNVENNNVKAKPVIHKVPDAIDGSGKSTKTETESCHFLLFKSSTLKLRIDTGGAEKTGYLWKIADSEGAPLFCLNPDKHNNGTCIYNRSRAVTRNDSRFYYQAYQYYLDNMGYKSALLNAQTAFWYFKQTPSPVSEAGLANALYTALLSQLCYDNQTQIKKELGADNDFTCEKFFTEGSKIYGTPYTVFGGVRECDSCKKTDKDGNCVLCERWARDGRRTLNYQDYINLFEFGAINTQATAGMDTTLLVAQYKSDSNRIANTILNYKEYPYTLYIWEPTNPNCQTFVGLAGCPKKVPECEDRIKDLVNKTEEQYRIKNNTNYFNQLNVILYDQPKSKARLNDPEFVKNPSCDPKTGCLADLDQLKKLNKNSSEFDELFNSMIVNYPGKFNGDKDNPLCTSTTGGSNCITDLQKLQKYDELGDTENYNKLFEEMKINYPGEFNGSDKNPDCINGDPEPCDPEYEDNYCEFTHTERTLYMSDNKRKTCWNDQQTAYRTDDAIVSSVFEGVSPYCTVTCHELFQVDFPPGKDNIKAGEEFFWGFGEPGEAYFGNVNASKNCYTSYPNYNQFLADWNTNEDRIKQAYAEYMAQVKYNEKSGYTKSNDTCCVSGEHAATSGTCNWAKESSTFSNPGGCTGPGGSKPCDWNDHGQGLGWYYISCTGGTTYSCDNPGYKYSRGAETYTYPGTSITGTSTSYSECRASDPSESDVDNSSAESSRLTSLNSLIAGRSTLKANLEKCYSNSAINENTIYHNVTNIKLTYTDPANTNRNIDGATLINKDNWSSFNSYGVVDQSGTITLNCSDTPGVAGGDTCGNVIQKYIEYYWDFVGLWKYYYNPEIFSWKFLLENGHAVNIKKFNESYSSFHSADGTVGFIASFKLITGFYEFAKVDVQGFGSDGHFNELYRSENEGSDIYTYSCPFKVTNEIYGSECRYDCDYNAKTCKITADSPVYCKTEVKGLDVVYRIIELTSAEEAAAGNINTVFPGIVGTGRKLGTNWSNFYKDNRTKYNNITTYNNIYDGGPIYTIDLTPALIQEIRADNATYRNHKDGETNKPMDPYTSMKYTNGTKKYLCSDDTPKDQTCASEWLSNLSQRGLLTGEYGEIKDTKARLEAIRKAKDSTEASGTKNVTVVGGA